MRHFRITWPTILAAVGCTTFLLTWIATRNAISDDGAYYYQQKYGALGS